MPAPAFFLHGVFVVFFHDTSVADEGDGNSADFPSRAKVAREVANVVEPSEFDVLLVAADSDQISPVFRALKSLEVSDARVTSTCSTETAQSILGLQSFDVVIGCGTFALEFFAELPELCVRSATLIIVDSPTAEVSAQAFTAGAMAVLATDEISTSLLQRTLQQILLRREAQNLLLDRLFSSSVGAQSPLDQLISPHLPCARSKVAGPIHEAVPAAPHYGHLAHTIWRQEI